MALLKLGEYMMVVGRESNRWPPSRGYNNTNRYTENGHNVFTLQNP